MRLFVRSSVVATVAILCVIAVHRWIYTPLACNRRMTVLTRNTSLVAGTTDPYQRLRRGRENVRELLACRVQCPTDFRLYLLIAETQEILGQPENMLLAYRQALAVEQRPEIHLGIGYSLVMLGKPEEAVSHYVEAARFDRRTLDAIPSEEVSRLVKARLNAPL